MSKRTSRPTDTRLAIGYVRVSTDEQARGGVSLDAQAARVREYAERAGLELVAVIREEGVSGTVPIAERPGGAELLRLLEATAAGNVVAVVLDRLSRDVVDGSQQVREWTRQGVAVHFTDGGGRRDTASATGRLHVNLDSSIAQYWRDTISDRTRAALALKKARGEAMGRPPRGCLIWRAPDGRQTALVRDPASDGRRMLDRARQLRAGGLSYAAIAATLTAEGFRPKRPDAIHPRIAAETVRRMLRNPRLAAVA